MYEYEVFISYRRADPAVPAWVHTHFHPRLVELLDLHLSQDARVFCDKNVGGGARWPDSVRKALSRARILVPVCSPKYFYDEWCLAEWYTMAKREELAGVARTLIYPVIFCDSKSFPDWAHERRMQDFRPWAKPYEHFQVSLGYLDFHDEVTRIAEELGELIELAPEWQSDWPVLTPTPPPPPASKLPRF